MQSKCMIALQVFGCDVGQNHGNGKLGTVHIFDWLTKVKRISFLCLSMGKLTPGINSTGCTKKNSSLREAKKAP